MLQQVLADTGWTAAYEIRTPDDTLLVCIRHRGEVNPLADRVACCGQYVPQELTLTNHNHDASCQFSKKVVATWTTRQFPNCRGICITTDVMVAEALRGRGIGKRIRDIRMKAYRQAGFMIDLCTVRHDNKVQRHLMYNGGGVDVDIPHVNQDGNVIRLFAVDIMEATNHA